MPVHGPPAAISAYEGREEALKTSWVNSAYPGIPNPQPQLSVPFFTSSDVDPNGMVGLNPDGTWQLAKLYNWNTWKVPKVIRANIQQFFFDSMVRVSFEVGFGDIFRSAYVIQRATNADFTTGLVTAGIIRCAPEYDDADNALDTFYDILTGANTFRVRCLDETAILHSYTHFGDHGTYDFETSKMVNSIFDQKGVTAKFSFYDNTVTNGTWYYRVIPIDGRRDHSLAYTDSPGNYTGIGSESATVSGYQQGKAKECMVYPENVSDFNNRTADGKGLIMFTSFGDFYEDTSQTFQTSVTLTHDNIYDWYKGQGYVWVAVAENNGDGNRIPDNGTWVKVPGPLPIVSGLTADTTYQCWVEPFTEGEISQPGGGASSPGGDLTFTTAAVPGETIDSALQLDSQNNGRFNLIWTHNSDDDDYEIQYNIDNNGWMQASVITTTNWNDTNTSKAASITTQGRLIGDEELIEFRIKIVGTVNPYTYAGPYDVIH